MRHEKPKKIDRLDMVPLSVVLSERDSLRKFGVSVPSHLWAENTENVVMVVVMKPYFGMKLPVHLFVKALLEKGVLKKENYRKIKIIATEEEEIWYVYGNVNFTHEQEFPYFIKGDKLMFHLFDLTLLH